MSKAVLLPLAGGFVLGFASKNTLDQWTGQKNNQFANIALLAGIGLGAYYLIKKAG